MTWLADPSTKDESTIRAALRELPSKDQDWLIARARVRNALEKLRHEQALPVHTREVGKPIVFTRVGERERELDRVLQLKDQLFREEVLRRQGHDA